MIAPTAIIRGLGITIGIDVIDVPGTTGDYNTNLNLKGQRAAEIITSQEKGIRVFLYLSLKTMTLGLFMSRLLTTLVMTRALKKRIISSKKLTKWSRL